jgi:hypothetical protein
LESVDAMLGKTVISEAQTIHIHHRAQLEEETCREHSGHCKLRIYRVELRGMVGKDAAKHQRRPRSRCEERCCEPLLDADHPAAEILAKEVSFEVPCEKGESGAKVRRSHGPISKGGHLSSRLPNCHLG